MLLLSSAQDLAVFGPADPEVLLQLQAGDAVEVDNMGFDVAGALIQSHLYGGTFASGRTSARWLRSSRNVSWLLRLAPRAQKPRPANVRVRHSRAAAAATNVSSRGSTRWWSNETTFVRSQYGWYSRFPVRSCQMARNSSAQS